MNRKIVEQKSQSVLSINTINGKLKNKDKILSFKINHFSNELLLTFKDNSGHVITRLVQIMRFSLKFEKHDMPKVFEEIYTAYCKVFHIFLKSGKEHRRRMNKK